MEAYRRVSFSLVLILFTVFYPHNCDGSSAAVTELDEDNWTRMLENEWMVEFMAPWCPACSTLKPTWHKLGSRARELGIHVAQVDVTTSPGLSGRFLVTALPTIYHVINGELRQYTGPRDVDSLVSFVVNSKWKAFPPSPWWRDPSQPYMAMLSYFFKLSQMLRSIHNTLLETYGLPTYGSYLIFAIATIFLGALLGLIVVCMIDFIFPPKQRSDRHPPSSSVSAEAELLNEDLVDEEEEDEGEDSEEDREKNSQSDTQSSDTEENSEKKDSEKDEEADDAAKDGSGDQQKNTASPNVRKRKSRKAD